MKLTRRIVTLALTLVLLAGVLTVPTFAAGYQMYGIGFVTATSLRLRQEPNTTSKILATAPRDECVVIISKVGQWYKVNYNLQEGYMHADYLNVKTARNAELGYGKVTGNSVNLRSGPGTSYAVVGSVKKGDTSCYIIGLNNGWYKVITGSKICYIRSDYLELTQIPYENKASSNSPKFFRLGNSTGVAPSPEALNGSSGSANNSSAPQPSASGSQILAKAQQYLGAPYVYGGASPSGFDCSGFVYYVYGTFGISVGRTPAEQYNAGMVVDKANLQPGDIVLFAGTGSSSISHTGIYAGNGQFIHSPNSRSTVSYSDLTSGYWSEHFYCGIRVV